MSETRTPVLGHFTTYRFTERFWNLEANARRNKASEWLDAVQASADASSVYLINGIESAGDVLVWNTVQVQAPDVPGSFFKRRARAESAFRSWVDPMNVLWGMTRPSEYSKARSAQEVDPFEPPRGSYLIAYPFTKTEEWYLLGRDVRQGMMNGHIRIGKQFTEITQLLLYSFGLQDQEFVVVYETEDLGLFSQLVYDLRSTEARRYTKADTPLHTGVLVDRPALLETLG